MFVSEKQYAFSFENIKSIINNNQSTKLRSETSVRPVFIQTKFSSKQNTD